MTPIAPQGPPVQAPAPRPPTVEEFRRDGFIALAEAARMLPTHRGKKVHCSSVYRLARKYGVPIRRLGPWRFVHLASLVECLRARPAPERRGA